MLATRRLCPVHDVSAASMVIGQGDQGSPGRVSRTDVAAVAISALDQGEASNRKTIELASTATDTLKADQLQHIFDGTTADV